MAAAMASLTVFGSKLKFIVESARLLFAVNEKLVPINSGLEGGGNQ